MLPFDQEGQMNDGLVLRVTYALSRVIFLILFSLLGLRRAVIRETGRSFPISPRRPSRNCAGEFLRRQSELAAEVLLASRIDPGELRDRVTLVRPEVLASATAPRPVILAGSHKGNFEWAQLRVSLELGTGCSRSTSRCTTRAPSAGFIVPARASGRAWSRQSPCWRSSRNSARLSDRNHRRPGATLEPR